MIGLLGGSFNPPHQGHKYISEIALNQFGLSELWWLVTPQNPLKNKEEYLPLLERMQKAKAITADNQKIKIKSLEDSEKDNYSHIIIKKLLKENRDKEFIWLMGADNIINFHICYNSCIYYSL